MLHRNLRFIRINISKVKAKEIMMPKVASYYKYFKYYFILHGSLDGGVEVRSVAYVKSP